MAAHDLDDESAVEGRRGVFQLIDALQGRIDGRVHADGDRRAADVVVDAGRHTHDREALLMQGIRALERSLPPDDQQAFDVMLTELLQGALQALWGTELRAPGAAQDRAPLALDSLNLGRLDREDAPIQQALIAVLNA